MANTPTELTRMNGRRLADRYEPIVKRGSGGMADVWEGVDHNLGRRIAIKVLHPHLAANDSILQRFRSEAHAAARLTHPGIVAIYDTVTTDDTDAIIMELVEGRDLRTLLDDRPTLALEDAVEVGTQLAAALGHAHQHGIIHRDVKPANILVRPDRRVKLSDFGIAKALDQASHTESGSLVGTVKYLAPEQLEGTGVDARTDLYALTTVLYEMLCGEVPFVATDLVSAMRRVRTDPPSARILRPDLSPAFDAFLQRGLARRPDDRFPDAQTWAASLKAAVRSDVTILDDAAATQVVRPTQPSSIPQRPAPELGAAAGIVGVTTARPKPGPTPQSPVAAPRPSGSSSPRRSPAKADPDVAKHHRRNRGRLAWLGPLVALGLAAAAIITVWLLLSGGSTTVDSTDDSSEPSEEVLTDEDPVETTSTEAPQTTSTVVADESSDAVGIVDDTQPAAESTAAPLETTSTTEATTTTTTTEPDFVAGRRTLAFDPFGDNDEHGEAVMRAIDGDPTTFWYTQSYTTRSFGNIKEGVGLILEFEQPQAMREIALMTNRVGWSTRIYEADATAPDLAGWGEPIGSFENLPQDAVLDVPDISITHLLIWITDLGLAPGQSAEDYDAQVDAGGFDQRLEINELSLVG